MRKLIAFVLNFYAVLFVLGIVVGIIGLIAGPQKVLGTTATEAVGLIAWLAVLAVGFRVLAKWVRG